MTRTFSSALDRLRDTWDRRAQDEVRASSDPGASGTDPAAFLASGEALVAAQVDPELAAIAAGRAARDLRVLDLGCGPGRLLRPLAARFGHVHGVDVSPRMLGLARRSIDGTANVHLHLGDGITLQCVRRWRFDFVLSYDTLAHLPDRALLVYLLRQVGKRLAPRALFKFHLAAERFSDVDVGALLEEARLTADRLARTSDSLWVWCRASPSR